MKSRPILFSGPMVRAILEGRKTQTRRVVKLPPPEKREMQYCQDPALMRAGDFGWIPALTGNVKGVREQQKDQHLLVPYRHREDEPMEWKDCGCERQHCPYGDPGDRLIVRENGWERPRRAAKMMRDGADTWAPFYYDADGISAAEAEQFKAWGFKRRPSILMPWRFSRLTLEIVSVRVERLNEISEADARAEGLLYGSQAIAGGYGARFEGWFHEGVPSTLWADPREAFENLWNSINGPGSWQENPWVWVVEFQRVEGGQP